MNLTAFNCGSKHFGSKFNGLRVLSEIVGRGRKTWEVRTRGNIQNL